MASTNSHIQTFASWCLLNTQAHNKYHLLDYGQIWIHLYPLFLKLSLSWISGDAHDSMQIKATPPSQYHHRTQLMLVLWLGQSSGRIWVPMAIRTFRHLESWCYCSWLFGNVCFIAEKRLRVSDSNSFATGLLVYRSLIGRMPSTSVFYSKFMGSANDQFWPLIFIESGCIVEWCVSFRTSLLIKKCLIWLHCYYCAIYLVRWAAFWVRKLPMVIKLVVAGCCCFGWRQRMHSCSSFVRGDLTRIMSLCWLSTSHTSVTAVCSVVEVLLMWICGLNANSLMCSDFVCQSNCFVCVCRIVIAKGLISALVYCYSYCH